MDIFEYPNALNSLEKELTDLRNEKDALEISFRDKRASIIATEIDIVPYKSASIRENFIIFHLAKSIECVNMERRL
jgi:predicted  nucleic acid-binding Zn-ribbon protein